MMADKLLQHKGISIYAGCGDNDRLAAAALWWRGMGQEVFSCVPARRGIGWVNAALRPQAALCAFDISGRLVGLAGLRGSGGGLLDWGVPMRPCLGPMRSALSRARFRLWRGGPATPDMVLDGLAVHPQKQKQGIATLLLQAAVAQASIGGYSGLQVEVDMRNEASLQLHRKAGFQEVGRFRAGHNRKALVLRKGC